MNNGPENRRSFRINESIYLKYEVLTEEEFHDGLDHRKIRLGQDDGAQALLVDIEARLGEAMFLLSGESEHVGRCITLLNDKMNVVIEQLPGLRQTKSALANSSPLSCEVGADGLVFPSAEKLPLESKLNLQYLLSTDNRYVETFCRVVRVTDPPPGNDTEAMPFGVAVEFVGMKQAQREILIQHMFNRESETLRMRRLEIEGKGL
jgi:hypothetical protein